MSPSPTDPGRGAQGVPDFTLQQLLIFLALTMVAVLAIMAWDRWGRGRR